MEFKNYLIETFSFNDKANRKVLSNINDLPDKAECIKLFSHLINCMNKWMAGIKNQPDASQLDWWEPVYPLEKLEQEWNKCFKLWIDYLEGVNEKDIEEGIKLMNFDGGNWLVKPRDIALQLNYHSIHHRGQMQYIIRRQGLKPKSIEYINDKYSSLD
jgi:uncharacterized damage-inducible protein DinB